MQDNNDLYEYAVIRLVPKVEREEFINVGLIMLCKRRRWLKMKFNLDIELIKTFDSTIDTDFITENLNAFKEIALGSNEISPIAKMDPPERFRWLTAVRSSIIQTSRPHVGLSEDLKQTFNKLFEDLIQRD